MKTAELRMIPVSELKPAEYNPRKKLKGKPLSEETLREVTALKDANTKRAAELRQMYIREE